MSLKTVIAVLEELADLMEIDGANSFRVRAHRNAIRALESTTESIEELHQSTGGLQSLAGIGKDLAAKIGEILDSGSCSDLQKLKQKLPPELPDLLRLPGVGPKKVATLHKQLQVNSLEDLRVALDQGAVASLKGFGKKTAENMHKALDQLGSAEFRWYLADALPIVREFVEVALQCEDVHAAQEAGSSRRRKQTVGDLDLIVSAEGSENVMQAISAHQLVEEVLQKGETKMRVRLSSPPHPYTPEGRRYHPEMDVRVVQPHQYGAACQYFTGSKEHNVVLRGLAKENNWKLNEYGLFEGENQICGAEEREIYEQFELPWIAPELRENRVEFDSNVSAELVTIDHVIGDLHMHTTATDGKHTIEQMAEAAKERGLKYIAITDHSQRVSMANGLNADRLRAQWEQIDQVNQSIDGIEILKGIECDILEDATLDLPEDVLAEADWVLGVLHYGLRQPKAQIMQRLLMAIESPHVDCIGHLTGRIIGHREPAEMDVEVLFEAMQKTNTMLEINAHPARLDVDDLHAAKAKSMGIPIVINTDAHSTSGFDVLQWGVAQARRAGLAAADVWNTKSWNEIQAYRS